MTITEIFLFFLAVFGTNKSLSTHSEKHDMPRQESEDTGDQPWPLEF